MATRTWGGGTHNWSATAAWVEGIVPTANDDVLIGTGTGGSTTGTLTVDGLVGTPSLCQSITCTSFVGTLALPSGAYLAIGSASGGSCTLASGMTVNQSGVATFHFVSTTTGNTITCAGQDYPIMIFDGVGGYWTCQDTLLVGTVAQALAGIVLINGTLNTNGQSVTCNQFNSSYTNTRSLILGATNWTLYNTSVTNLTSGLWDIGTSTGMTLSAASSTITLNVTSGIDKFNGGGLTYGTLTSTALSGSTGTTPATVTINQANTFGTLTLSCGANMFQYYAFGASQTISGTLTGAGNSAVNRLLYRAATRGTSYTLTAATVTLSYIDIQDCTGAGAGSWDLHAITGLSGDCGGNSGITFTTPATSYWVVSGGTSTGSMSAVTRWASASNGTAGTGRSPLPQDTSIFDSHSIGAAGVTVTQDKPRVGSINWTGATNSPTFSKSAVTSFFGTLTYISTVTYSGTGAWTYEGRGSQTVNTGTTTWTNPLTIDCVSGTLTLAANFSSSSTLTMQSGTLASTSTYTFTFTTFTFNGGTFSPVASTTLSGAFLMAGGTLNPGQTFTGQTTLTVTGGTWTLAAGISFTTGAFQAGTILGAYTIACSSTVTFSTSGTVTCEVPAITCTNLTFNGASGTFNVGTITASGTATFTAGTVNAYGTITFTGGKIIPNSGGASGGSFTFGG